jgi:hypothetical protein
MTAVGQEEPFRMRRLSDEKGGLRSFAGTRAGGEVAPIPDLPAGRRWNIKFEEVGSVDYTVDLHRMTAPNVSIPS